MKKLNIRKHITLFQVISKNTCRNMKLIAFLLFVTGFNAFGSKSYLQQVELMTNTNTEDSFNNRQVLLANKEDEKAFSLQQKRITAHLVLV
jgi:hypothetical protein